MEKIIQKKKKIFAYIFLFIILFSFLGNTCKAEINTDYGDSSTVTDIDLEKSMKGSALLDAIAQLLYALASWIEHAVGVGFAQLTGSNEFPWADRIIFNTVRMLDINFINPSQGSMFNSNGSDTILAKIVKNVYYTVLSLAVGFLGVAVGIMAVRLAISTIASEKARYKEAIMNWLLGIVMLFTMHFILSFVFYTNEQMVKIASNILTNAIENAGIEFNFKTLADSVVSPEDRFKNYCDSNGLGDTYNGLDDVTRRRIAGYLISDSEYVSKRLPDSLDPGDGQNLSVSLNIISDTINNWTWATNYSNGALISNKAHSLTEDSDWAQVVYNAEKEGKLKLSNLEEFKSTLPNLSINPEDHRNFEYKKEEFWGLFETEETSFSGYFPDYAIGMSLAQVVKNNFDAIQNRTFNQDELEKQTLNLAYEYTNILYRVAAIANGDGLSGSAVNLISGMGEYFKATAFVYTSEEDESSGETKITGWRASKITLTGALLYAIFIIQSLMYFIQYIKRFFYIIILSLIGPAVVIYDFVTKSLK